MGHFRRFILGYGILPTPLTKPLKSTKSVAHEIKVKGMSRRVCHGQLLCKVSNSQLSLMQRKPNFDVKTKLRFKTITKLTDCEI